MADGVSDPTRLPTRDGLICRALLRLEQIAKANALQGCGSRVWGGEAVTASDMGLSTKVGGLYVSNKTMRYRTRPLALYFPQGPRPAEISLATPQTYNFMETLATPNICSG
jgi:hypothetical protein